MHIVAIGGSDAGISAALRAREVDPGAEFTVVVADAYPNFSICGIPYYVSGEVARWRNLAHRTIADLEAAGMRLRLDTLARRIDVPGRKLTVTGPGGAEDIISYDELVIGTGAVPARPPIAGLDALGPGDGVHLLHSMDDTFAVMRTLQDTAPDSAVIVGAGYIGLEMADALTTRGLRVTQLEQLPEVLPTVDGQLGALVRAELEARGVTVLTGTAVQEISRAQGSEPAPLRVDAVAADGAPVTVHAGLVLVVTGVRPETSLAVSAGAALGARGAISVDTAMRTGLPGIYAAGDCVITYHRLLGETYLPLGTTAHKQGRVAGENAAGGHREFAGSLGTQVVKIFSHAAARTGLRDHEAAAAGFDPVTIGVRGRRPQGLLSRQPPHRHAVHRRPGHRPAARRPAVRPQGRRDRQADRHRRHRHLPRHDRRPDKRPGPVLHPAARLPLGRRAGRRPGLDPPGHRQIRPLTTRTAPMPHLLSRTQTRQAAAYRGSARRRGGARHHRRAHRMHIRLSTSSTLQATAAGTSTVRLTGAGSTFDAPFFTKAFAAYQQSRPGVTVSYASVGSSAGITRFTAGTVNSAPDPGRVGPQSL